MAFRDYLRDHPAAAHEYEDLKQDLARHLAATTPESREEYARAKTEFIERIVVMALSDGYPKELLLSDGAEEIIGPERVLLKIVREIAS